MMRRPCRCPALLVAPLFASPALADCTKDTDCKGDRVCDAGKCVEPRASSAAPAPPTGPGAQGATYAVPRGAPAAAAPPVAAELSPVAFEPENPDDNYTVIVPALQQSCQAPCTLSLPAGRVEVQIEGSGNYTAPINVPRGGMRFVVRRRSTGKLTAGITLLSIGAPAVVAGLTLYVLAANMRKDDDMVAFYAGGSAPLVSGIVMTIVGGVLVGGRGANRIDEVRVGATAPRFTAAGLAPVPGGGVASASFTFGARAGAVPRLTLPPSDRGPREAPPWPWNFVVRPSRRQPCW